MNTQQPLPREDIYRYIGKRLRTLRLSQGLTQAGVAKRLNVSPQQYQKYEDATSRCNLNNLATLADMYEVPISFIFPQPDFDAEELNEPMVDEADLLARLVSAFVGIRTSTERHRVVQLLEAMTEKK